MELRHKYGIICQDYVDLFCKKHNLTFKGWEGNKPGTIARFKDYIIDFEDIRLDIDTNQHKDHFKNWYYLRLDKKLNYNYKSYCMELRPETIRNEKKES